MVDLEWVMLRQLIYLAWVRGGFVWFARYNDERNFENGEAPKAVNCYFECLEVLELVPAQEEAKITKRSREKFSYLIKWS